MKSKIQFLGSLLLTSTLIYTLSIPISTSEAAKDDSGKAKEKLLPPAGPFFNPFEGFWQNAEPVAPSKLLEKIESPDIKGKVKVVFDQRMVPHIFAENLEEACFAHGYVVAQNRLWQMDMTARLAGGRLAEILGPDLLGTDKLQRRRGLLAGAKKAVASWESAPESFRLIQAYVDGVNAYIRQLSPRDYPLEFKLLNYKPEEWSILKSALVKKYMDLTLCFGEEDLEATNALAIFGREVFDKLYPQYFPKQTPVIPAGTAWAFEKDVPGIAPSPVPQEAVGLISHKLHPKERILVGSNNWAVSGDRTRSGNPILCNDPHLRLSLPAIWFEAQLQAPGINAYGVSVPGIPGILIGFNDKMAWGVTNVGHDLLDWYRVKWTDDRKQSYDCDGGSKNAELVINAFQVRGQVQPVYDTVKWTVWGPVVYESAGEPRNDLAMRWIGHLAPDPGEINTFLGLNTSQGYEDYAASLRSYSFPAQNFVMASGAGDIAMTVNGKLPVKAEEEGRFVHQGEKSNGFWQQWIPREHLPQVKNPLSGFVSSANQHSTDPSYPYYYLGPHFDQFRGRYLNQQLASLRDVTAEDMMNLQQSNFSLHAAEGLPVMLRLTDTTQLSAVQKGIWRQLNAWDFRFQPELAAPALFVAWWEAFYESTFDEIMGLPDSIPMLLPDKWRLTDLADHSPQDPVFDLAGTQEIETAQDMATRSFQRTVDSLSEKLSSPGFNWASQKRTSIMHLTSIPAFSRINLPVGGYKEALNAISESHGPSWRMVVEIGKADVKAWGVYPGGSSGNPGSPFYDPGVETWMSGDYYELFFMKDPDDQRQAKRYTLQIN
jgi:penicillin amidase